MKSLTATVVDVDIDKDYSEDRVSFVWSDPHFGSEGLTIEFDGHCSRKMPIRSGMGPPTVLGFKRDSITFEFPEELAEQLELPEILEIRFSIDDETFGNLAAQVARMTQNGKTPRSK